jgi:hypothetical protein
MWTQLGRSKAVSSERNSIIIALRFFELANQQDIAYGQPWKLVRFLASLAVALFQWRLTFATTPAEKPPDLLSRIVPAEVPVPN